MNKQILVIEKYFLRLSWFIRWIGDYSIGIATCSWSKRIRYRQ